MVGYIINFSMGSPKIGSYLYMQCYKDKNNDRIEDKIIKSNTKIQEVYKQENGNILIKTRETQYFLEKISYKEAEAIVEETINEAINETINLKKENNNID